MTDQIGVMCAGFVVFFLLLFGLLALLRWLRHKETMAMIQQGMAPPKIAKPLNGSKRSLLLWGIGIGVFGLVLMLAMGGLSVLVISSGGVSNVARMMMLLLVPGLTVLFAGVALLILYFVVQPTREARAGADAQPSFEAEMEVVPSEPAGVEFEAKVGK
jgi:sterol desaturase/sphingolipid hydroxylase (fatty acid hydroxylase superfamily)